MLAGIEYRFFHSKFTEVLSNHSLRGSKEHIVQKDSKTKTSVAVWV